MQLSTRLSLAAAIGIVATTAACGGSSTGPGGGGGPTPGTLAQHFDTLYQHAKASSVSDTNFIFRAQALSFLELAAAFGAAPTTITVTTSTGTEQWKGFVFEEDSSGAVDSATFIVAYRDSLVHTMILSGLRGNGTSLFNLLLANDTIGIPSSSQAESATLTSVGSSCPTPIAGLVNPVIAAADSTTCTLAQFNASLALGFPATTGVDPALTAVSFTTTSIAGERFVDAATAGSRVPLASLLRRRLKASY